MVAHLRRAALCIAFAGLFTHQARSQAFATNAVAFVQHCTYALQAVDKAEQSKGCCNWDQYWYWRGAAEQFYKAAKAMEPTAIRFYLLNPTDPFTPFTIYYVQQMPALALRITTLKSH